MKKSSSGKDPSKDSSTSFTEDASSTDKCTLFNISSLRCMPDLKHRAKKELRKLVVLDSSYSDSSERSDSSLSSSDDDFLLDVSYISKCKKHKKPHKNKRKSGITSKSPDFVKIKQTYPHLSLRFDFVSKNITFEILDFNLFAAGELEIISSSKISDKEKSVEEFPC